MLISEQSKPTDLYYVANEIGQLLIELDLLIVLLDALLERVLLVRESVCRILLGLDVIVKEPATHTLK